MDNVDCTIYLSRPVELEQQACLTGKQILPEVELSHAIATHHTAACLTPGGLQNLSHIITICLATCSMGSHSQTDSDPRRLTCVVVQSGRQAEHRYCRCTKPLCTLFVQLFCEAVCILTGPFWLIGLSHKDSCEAQTDKTTVCKQAGKKCKGSPNCLPAKLPPCFRASK